MRELRLWTQEGARPRGCDERRRYDEVAQAVPVIETERRPIGTNAGHAGGFRKKNGARHQMRRNAAERDGARGEALDMRWTPPNRSAHEVKLWIGSGGGRLLNMSAL
jgi:hypothetical protein